MTKHNYQRLNEHREEHRKLTLQVEDFLDEYSQGNKNLDEEVFEFLKKWLFDHILVTDKKMGEYLRMRGLS